MAGRHSAPGEATGKNEYAGRHRATPPVPPPSGFLRKMGQPAPGETPQAPARRLRVAPAAAPVRHGGQKPVGAVKAGGRFGYTPQHGRTVKSQTKRDRATRRESQRKATSAFGGALRALWNLGKS